MKKLDRLRKNKDFALVCRHGRRWSSPFFNIYIRKNRMGCIRLGVSVSKRLGNAVVRNRCKRRLKEAFRSHLKSLNLGFDVVIAAKPPIKDLHFSKIVEELEKYLKRGGVWSG